MKVITMKGQTNYDYNLIVRSHERMMLPTQNDEYRTIAGKDGQEHIPKELGNIQIVIQFFRPNVSWAQWIKERPDVVQWLHSRGEIQIEFDDMPNGYYVGKITETSVMENFKPDVGFDVTFTLQPFHYGPLIEKPLSLHNNAATVVSGGNYETPYVLTIEPNTTVDGFTLRINGVKISYTGNLIRGNIVTVDTHELELRVDGALKVQEVDGYFHHLEPGNSLIGIDIAADLSIAYQERSI